MSLFSRFSVMARVLGMVSLQSMRAAEAGVALRALDLPRVSARSSEQAGLPGELASAPWYPGQARAHRCQPQGQRRADWQVQAGKSRKIRCRSGWGTSS